MNVHKTLLLSLLGCWGCVSGQGENDVKLEYMRFDLYTRNTAEPPPRLWPNDSCSVINSDYRCDRPTKLIMPGFRADSIYANITGAFLNRSEEYNVIAVDWDRVWDNSKDDAERIKRIRPVAYYQAQMIDLLVELGTDPRNISLVGIDEGALVASSAAKETNNTVGHFVALDPWNINTIYDEIYPGMFDEFKVSKSDADFVEIVYSEFEIEDQFGHASYYINNDYNSNNDNSGVNTIFVPLPRLFPEAIKDPKLFVGRKCQSYEAFMAGDCNANSTKLFPNSLAVMKEEGNYYLRTNDEPPYGLGIKGSYPPNYNGPFCP